MKNPSSDQGAAVVQARSWTDELQTLADSIGCHFPHSESRQRVLAYLKGLLSPVERKNSWQLAEQAGDSTPYGLQHLLGRAQWSVDAVRDDLQAYVIHHLADSDGVLILDETGFLKKGNKSAGVARQYSGTAGRIENSQIGVFLVYASSKGRTFLDRELYLPKAWTKDRVRCKAAAIPEEVKFSTKLQLGRRMLQPNGCVATQFTVMIHRCEVGWTSGDRLTFWESPHNCDCGRESGDSGRRRWLRVGPTASGSD